MENNHIIQEKIQALVNGELDEAERRALLEAAKTDPELARELTFSWRLATALKHSDVLTANALIASVIETEGFPPPDAPAPRWKKWWTWIGMAMLGTVLLTSIYFYAESSGAFLTSSQKIGREALQPLENVLFTANSDASLQALQQGMEAYDARRYSEATQALQTYLAQRNDNAARVYLGVSLLMDGQAQRAIAPLADAARSQEPPVQEAALWYLALCQLETNNTRAAIQTLQSIPPGGLLENQVNELLKKLE